MPDQVYSVQWNGSKKLGFAYDNLGRLAQKSFGGNSFGIKYAYENYEIAKENGAAEKRTTTLVKSVETPAGTYSYEYDKLGNIVSVASGSYVTSYEYDSLNQLTRVNDEKAGKTITYSYTNGNITEQKEYEYTTGELGEEIAAKTWSYTDSVWSDLLTDFNGTQIAYDEIGNPLSIGSKQLTWLGRQLQNIADGENTIEYAYNGDGNRISKTVNGVKTEFVYNGDILAGQKSGNDTLVFMYDNNSDIFGFILNGTEYYYIKNAQNDVTAIADKDGNVLAEYAYDSWGKVTEITGNTALAEQNPIRYRSYYFDFETEWYFLNTRYYSPDMCRFINSDNLVVAGSDLTGFNLFAYCGNSPVNRVDPKGNRWVRAFIKTVFVITKIICTIKEIKRVKKELSSLPRPKANITKSFRNTLRSNANTIKKSKKNDGYIKTAKLFYNNVRNKGPWDLKQQTEYQGTFQFNEFVIQTQDIGNINFGYTGKALGLPDWVLLAGAGVAQMLAGTSNFSFVMASNGDDLRDQMYILYGIMLYKEDNKGGH